MKPGQAHTEHTCPLRFCVPCAEPICPTLTDQGRCSRACQANG